MQKYDLLKHLDGSFRFRYHRDGSSGALTKGTVSARISETMGGVSETVWDSFARSQRKHRGRFCYVSQSETAEPSQSVSADEA